MQERLQSELDRLPELQAFKQRNGGKTEQVRASSTDADASFMKRADGGCRPDYNTQQVSDWGSQIIVGAEVNTSGSDMAQLAPMVEKSNSAWAAHRRGCSSTGRAVLSNSKAGVPA